jgi:5'-nucleotidase (lipoprotein e(P4) family)
MKNTFMLFICLGLISCSTRQNGQNSSFHDDLKINNSEYLAQAVLWFQRSPETQALYLQSYKQAGNALAFNLNHKKFNEKKNAVVVDIDETILNNGPYEARLILNNMSYSDSTWDAWVQESSAEPLPGAAEFLNYATKVGCDIFYISNRKKDTQTESTLRNLQKFNLPDADENHLMLKGREDTTISGRSSKEKRRLKIENELGYEILLLVGDQLTDFSKSFDIPSNASESQIKDSVNKYQDLFGTRYIIIPNPMYSDWLNSIIMGSDRNYSPVHLDSLRKAGLRSR